MGVVAQCSALNSLFVQCGNKHVGLFCQTDQDTGPHGWVQAYQPHERPRAAFVLFTFQWHVRDEPHTSLAMSARTAACQEACGIRPYAL